MIIKIFAKKESLRYNNNKVTLHILLVGHLTVFVKNIIKDATLCH
jgi:hypothetical protein